MPDHFLLDLLGTAVPLVVGGFLAGLFTYWFERRRVRLERNERRTALLESLRRELGFVPDQLPSYTPGAVHLLPPIRTIVGAQLLDGQVLDWRSDAELVQPLLEFLSVAGIYNDLVSTVNAAQAGQAWADDVQRHWFVQLLGAHSSLLNTQRTLLAQLNPTQSRGSPAPLAQLASIAAPTDAWRVDLSHSRLGFSAKHMGIVTVHGQFERAEVQLEYDPEDETHGTVQIRIDAASVNTGDDRRDADLRSAHFLNAEVYPWLIFVSTSFVRVAAATFRLEGDLTIRGVSRPISLEVHASKAQPDGQGGVRRGFSLRGRINRTHWGLTWNVPLETGGLLVSEEVELLLEIAAVGPTRAAQIAATQATATQASAPQSTATQANATLASAARIATAQATSTQASATQAGAPQASTIQASAPQANTPRIAATESTATQASATQSSAARIAATESGAGQSSALQSTAPQAGAAHSSAPQAARAAEAP